MCMIRLIYLDKLYQKWNILNQNMSDTYLKFIFKIGTNIIQSKFNRMLAKKYKYHTSHVNKKNKQFLNNF